MNHSFINKLIKCDTKSNIILWFILHISKFPFLRNYISNCTLQTHFTNNRCWSCKIQLNILKQILFFIFNLYTTTIKCELEFLLKINSFLLSSRMMRVTTKLKRAQCSADICFQLYYDCIGNFGLQRCSRNINDIRNIICVQQCQNIPFWRHWSMY